MKKCVKNIIFSILLFGIAIISKDVFAASASISGTNTVYVGDPATVTVSIYGAAWNVTVSGAANEVIAGYNQDAVNQSVTKTYSINTSAVGTYTVSISGDVTDETSDVATPIGGSATITVIARPVITPDPTPPANNNTNNGGATTNGNNNSSNANTNANNNNTNASTETKTEETKTAEPAKTVKPIEVTKFEIVGYDFKFDADTKTYTLNIDKNISKLYLIVEGKEISVEGNGIVDIADKDKVTLKIKNSDQEAEYTINLNKQSLGNSVSVSAKSKGNIFMSTTVIFGWSTVILAFFLAKDMIKFRKQSKESL